MMKKYLSLIVLLPMLVLAGCSADSNVDEPAPYSKKDLKSASLEILYSNEEPTKTGAPIDYVSYTLKCLVDGRVEGTHPKAEESCAHLKANPEIFQPKIDDDTEICTMIYGGPQKATIVGEINDKEVSFELDRVNGCSISVWDSWGPVVSFENLEDSSTVN
jgi:hypothetical protein